MKQINYLCLALILLLRVSSGCVAQVKTTTEKSVRLSKSSLLDKIKGGWAGQNIGVTYGGPTEFHYCGVVMPDTVPLKWYDGYMKETMINIPGLYDDIYMDLTFLDVYHRLGLNAPVDSFANAFAHATFPLDQANQAARYNILHGIPSPKSGHWLHNPHADDIDFQIESDFIGLMCPGMPNTASTISDKIGHIMNYGDGWYGGVYMGAMYAHAFVSDDVQYIVEEGLKSVPQKSEFYQCIADVIKWHKLYPNDWKKNWQLLEDKWSNDLCPDGALMPFNIDAKMNAAYVVLGLLYGEGDYGKTLEISTRAGQDSDCNPSSAGGILGTALGYNAIPAYWKMGLKEVEDLNFKYTDYSLNRAYDTSYKLALEVIKKNGGKIVGDEVIIKKQKPKAVRYEKSFPGLYANSRTDHYVTMQDTNSISFTGQGFVWRGTYTGVKQYAADYTFIVDVYIDGKKTERVELPTNNLKRRRDICWDYTLDNGPHVVKLVLTNPHPEYELKSLTYTVYGPKK